MVTDGYVAFLHFFFSLNIYPFSGVELIRQSISESREAGFPVFKLFSLNTMQGKTQFWLFLQELPLIKKNAIYVTVHNSIKRCIRWKCLSTYSYMCIILYIKIKAIQIIVNLCFKEFVYRGMDKCRNIEGNPFALYLIRFLHSL